MEVKVLENQSLFDLAVQECGGIEAVFGLAVLNGLSVTDSVEPGTLLKLTSGLVASSAIRGYYQARKLKPATNIELDENGEFTDWADNGRIFAIEFPYEFE